MVSLGLGVLMSVMLYRLVRASKRAGKKQTRLMRELLSRLTDTLGSVKPLKAMARYDVVDALLKRQTHKLNRAMERQVLAREGMKAIQEPILTLFVAVGLYLALVVWGLSLPSVMVMVFLLARVVMQLNQLQRRYQQMQTQESAYWALKDAVQAARDNAEQLHNQADIAAEFLELARKERQLGNRSLLDVLAGETALINASSDAASADTDVTIVAFTLLSVMGKLSPNVVE